MGLQTRTRNLIEAATEILSRHRPMTVRQVYYQLVSRQVLENTNRNYHRVSNALVTAREQGLIPWEWIEDRLRRPRGVSVWDDLGDFMRTVGRSYHRDMWATQPIKVAVWCEKDALSGIFEAALEPYRLLLHVGRGYDSASSVKAAADRFGDGRDVFILYFGDFDPSGVDIQRSLGERLGEHGCHPEVSRCALSQQDIDRYHLPADFTKAKDSRSAAFVKKHGDVAVELDALPVDVLRRRITNNIERHIDWDAWKQMEAVEAEEQRRLDRWVARLGKES